MGRRPGKKGEREGGGREEGREWRRGRGWGGSGELGEG